GKVLEPAPAPRFSRTPAADPPPPGAPGADGEAILAELGRSEDEIARLREAGVLR
ncbi:MAG: CoA transferase, partial [Alphaproteobacteria bacterium]